MAGARKLGPETTQADAASGPPSREPLVVDQDPAGREAFGMHADLSAMHVGHATPTQSSATELRVPRPAQGGAGRTALALFVIGFLAFLAGVALASAIVLGTLDVQQSGWVKDVVVTVKTFVHGFTHK